MKDLSLIAMVLDRSGSMENCKKETVKAFNHFMDAQRWVLTGRALVTVAQFDHEVQISTPTMVNILPKLGSDEMPYQPRGGTNLLDAIGTTIDYTKKWIAQQAEEDRPENVVVVIQTDGDGDNASSRYTLATTKQLIVDLRKRGWQFLFLGAGGNAPFTAAQLGIAPAQLLEYDMRSSLEAFQKLSDSVTAARTGNVARLA